MNIFQPPVLCCMLGAVAVQLLQIAEASKVNPRKKINFRSVEIYLSVLSAILIAGIVGYIYFDGTEGYGKVVYFHTGASSPFLVRSLTSRLPEVLKPEIVESEVVKSGVIKARE